MLVKQENVGVDRGKRDGRIGSQRDSGCTCTSHEGYKM